MPFVPTHSIQRGIHRLLRAPDDVPVKDALSSSGPPPKAHQAPAPFQSLFAEYRRRLADAASVAEVWWDRMIQRQMGRGASAAAADAAVRDLVFAGPAAHGEVVFVVRTYWLRAVALNREVPPAVRVPPQVLLLGWLIDAGEQHLVDILTAMPYWPLGIDANGNWA